MSMETMPLTIDRLELSKGSIISVELIEMMTEECKGTDAYNLALIKLIGEIDVHLRRQDTIVTICSIKGAIHILTDPEAAVYNARQGELAVGKLGRVYQRNKAVDKSQLDVFDIQIHRRDVELQGKMLTEIHRVRTEFRCKEHVRKTPGLPK